MAKGTFRRRVNVVSTVRQIPWQPLGAWLQLCTGAMVQGKEYKVESSSGRGKAGEGKGVAYRSLSQDMSLNPFLCIVWTIASCSSLSSFATAKKAQESSRYRVGSSHFGILGKTFVRTRLREVCGMAMLTEIAW